MKTTTNMTHSGTTVWTAFESSSPIKSTSLQNSNFFHKQANKNWTSTGDFSLRRTFMPINIFESYTSQAINSLVLAHTD